MRFAAAFTLAFLGCFAAAGTRQHAASPCAAALERNSVCPAANHEAARQLTARNLTGAVVVEDVRRGGLVAFGSAVTPAEPVSTPRLEVTSSVLPLSIAKVFLAASWWEHAAQIS